MEGQEELACYPSLPGSQGYILFLKVDYAVPGTGSYIHSVRFISLS
jgi:hypothetical protein